MLIANYGLHWHADRVFWGKGKAPGQLLGRGSVAGVAAGRGLRRPTVDFREQIGIYALYSDYRLIYVGQAGGINNYTLFNRLKAHRRDHLAERWDRFSWFGLKSVSLINGDPSLTLDAFGQEPLEPKVVVNFLEAIILEVVDDLLNRQGGRLGDAVNFSQVTHESALGTIGDRISLLKERNAKLHDLGTDQD